MRKIKRLNVNKEGCYTDIFNGTESVQSSTTQKIVLLIKETIYGQMPLRMIARNCQEAFCL